MDESTVAIARLSLIAAILAFVVVALGAYTRLSDAGLGCPDWPGCYGHLSVPSQTKTIHEAEQLFLSQPLVPQKAWAEMIHRYFAGALACLIAVIAFWSAWLAYREKAWKRLALSGALLFLLGWQPLLGMWTVTLKLWPIIVSLHLLVGLGLLALLWAHYWTYAKTQKTRYRVGRFLVWACRLSMVLVFMQIALGAWTSTNYAAIACDSFPFCQLAAWHWNWHQAFHLFSPMGFNYQGGLLPDEAKKTIQMVHRIGALLVFSYMVILSALLLHRYHRAENLVSSLGWVWGALFFQLCLGVANVELARPLWIAILHNLGAAFLLLSLVRLNLYGIKR